MLTDSLSNVKDNTLIIRLVDLSEIRSNLSGVLQCNLAHDRYRPDMCAAACSPTRLFDHSFSAKSTK